MIYWLKAEQAINIVGIFPYINLCRLLSHHSNTPLPSTRSPVAWFRLEAAFWTTCIEGTAMTNHFSTPILIAEDSNTMGRIISGLLKQIGFQKVDLAHGGVTALAKMRETAYGLMISDWNMQPMTGLDLLKQIRS